MTLLTRTIFALGMASALMLGEPVAAQQIDYRPPGLSDLPERVLSREETAFYANAFDALNRQDWVSVRTAIDNDPFGALRGTLAAEYFLHPNSPRISIEEIEAWLQRYPTHPQAERMIGLGIKRGLVEAPILPRKVATAREPSIPKRVLPRSVEDGTMPAEIGEAILSAIRNDDPDSARMLLDGIDASLSPASRTEWRQRVAWSYYIENRDTAALAMARTARGGTGPWLAEGAWVEGLAAWRLDDCPDAADAFTRASEQADNVELRSAAQYWAARAFTKCRQPALARQMLERASRSDETLYGMLATEQLGITRPDRFRVAAFDREDWRKLRNDPIVRNAIGLAEINELELADETLLHALQTGDAESFASKARLAKTLGLTSAQKWSGYNTPRGAQPIPAMRYPSTAATPVRGWTVDPALAFAHSLQESDFRPRVVSPANAIGLMQIRPIAAREYAASIQMNASTVDLKDEATNIAFGQRALRALSQSETTNGHLPKVMAAYNAGPTPVARWNSEIRAFDDPLLYMESIPYWETRGYVAIVMRNYWIYLRQGAEPAPSREALAQNAWPEFPTKN
ncbi:lytic transglycosylase domain-containing protein [Parapontixanthobacter aurantiacus]|nr:lytic transglycosylase domain-containing protein [Parapontixanthobacter aurantiacus]